MGRIADRVAGMRGCRLSEIVAAIAEMEDGALFQVPPTTAPADEFELVWDHWPNRTAKKAAQKAYAAARKRGVTRETIIRGIHRYVETKPSDRPWLHLATFINGERWNDQPAPISAKPSNTSELRNDLRNRIAERQGREGIDDPRSVRRLDQRQAISGQPAGLLR